MRRKLTERLSVPGLRFTGGLPFTAKLSLLFIILVALGAALSPWIIPYSPLSSHDAVAAPSGEHWFGTDAVGRDIFSRVLYGSRFSLVIGIGATAVALVAAAILGSIAATANKAVSEVLMRIMHIIMSFPGIALPAAPAAGAGARALRTR